MKKMKHSGKYDGQIKIITKIDRRAVKTMKRYEEAAKARTGEIRISSYTLAKVTDVSFSVSLDRWKEIEQSSEWAAVKGMIEEKR